MPKTLRSGERELVLKVKSFCEKEKANKEPIIPLNQVRSRVAAMTGVTEKTVTKITKEGDNAVSTSSKITTPSKKRPHEKRVKLDDFDHSVKLNKVPTLSSTKAEMQEWITSKGLSFLQNMLKAQLYEIIKDHKEEPVYEVDSYLASHGHKVVRLPPYHCDLNPIELIWSILKRRVAQKNVGQEANKIVKLTEEAFDSITSDEWKKECDHVKNLETNYYAKDIQMDKEIDELIINVGGDSDTDSSDSSESDWDCTFSGIGPLDDHSY